MSFKKVIAAINLGLGFTIDPVAKKIHVAPQVEAKDVRVITVSARSQNGYVSSYAVGCTLVGAGVGSWVVAFDAPHPDGVNYHVSFNVEEQWDIKDAATVFVQQGTQTANGFSIGITQHDPNSLQDIPCNPPFSLEVAETLTIAVPL